LDTTGLDFLVMLECNMSLISKNSYKIDFQINPQKAGRFQKSF
jgi:hypothetical protein